MGVILYAHPVLGESHIQCNAIREVAAPSLLFYYEPHWSHLPFVKSAPGTAFTSWSQHHLLRLESLSGKCTKLHIVAASNNRGHMPWPLYYCLFAPHIWVFFFLHIPFMVNHTFHAMPPTERLQQ